MPSRIPETFAYPVIYPNGVVIYCDTQEEQEQLRMSLSIYMMEELKNNR